MTDPEPFTPERWSVDWKVTGPHRSIFGRVYWEWSLDEPRQGWVQVNSWSRTPEGRERSKEDAIAAARAAAHGLASRLNAPPDPPVASGTEMGGVEVPLCPWCNHPRGHLYDDDPCGVDGCPCGTVLVPTDRGGSR